jgi:hypothetical protein
MNTILPLYQWATKMSLVPNLADYRECPSSVNEANKTTTKTTPMHASTGGHGEGEVLGRRTRRCLSTELRASEQFAAGERRVGDVTTGAKRCHSSNISLDCTRCPQLTQTSVIMCDTVGWECEPGRTERLVGNVSQVELKVGNVSQVELNNWLGM